MAGSVIERSGRRPVRRANGSTKDLSIQTERRLGEDGIDTSGMSPCRKYVDKRRERRTALGTRFWIQCCVFFVMSLCSVFAAPRRSHYYYAAWTVCIASFLLLLPSVLPSDNTKINYLMHLVFGSTLVVFCQCVLSAVKQYSAYVSGECERAMPRAYCKWDMVFWTVHGTAALVLCFVWRYKQRNLKPIDKLDQFWRNSGYYFIAVGTVSLADKAAFAYCGMWENAESGSRIFWWNMVITVEEFVIGILCLSHRFKAKVWRKVATYGGVKAVDFPSVQKGQ